MSKSYITFPDCSSSQCPSQCDEQAVTSVVRFRDADAFDPPLPPQKPVYTLPLFAGLRATHGAGS